MTDPSDTTTTNDMLVLDPDAPLDTADYGESSGPHDEGPEDVHCLGCGAAAVDHSRGRYSIYGVCPKPDRGHRRNGNGQMVVNPTPIVTPAARTTDPGTSHIAAAYNLPGKESAAIKVLRYYAANERMPGAADGLTAREVEAWSRLNGPWKRVSDLLRHQFLAPVLTGDGREVTRAPAGEVTPSRAHRITSRGVEYLAQLALLDTADITDRAAVEADLAAGILDDDVVVF